MTTLTSATPRAGATIFELRSSAHTAAGPGETCLVCGDPLSVGEVYLFVAWDGEFGVAHEDCSEFETSAATESGGDLPNVEHGEKPSDDHPWPCPPQQPGTE